MLYAWINNEARRPLYTYLFHWFDWMVKHSLRKWIKNSFWRSFAKEPLQQNLRNDTKNKYLQLRWCSVERISIATIWNKLKVRIVVLRLIHKEVLHKLNYIHRPLICFAGKSEAWNVSKAELGNWSEYHNRQRPAVPVQLAGATHLPRKPLILSPRSSCMWSLI